MSSQEQEALARQLYAIHEEALGTGKGEWELESPAWREAWIQVAQFVEARSNEPLATDDNLITRIEQVKIDPKKQEWLDEQWQKIRSKRVWDQDRFIRSEFDEPDHK